MSGGGIKVPVDYEKVRIYLLDNNRVHCTHLKIIFFQ